MDSYRDFLDDEPEDINGKHRHNFVVVMREITKEGDYITLKECRCGKELRETSKTGDWIKA